MTLNRPRHIRFRAHRCQCFTLISITALVLLVAAVPVDAATGDAWNFTERGRWAYGPAQAISVHNGIAAVANGGYLQIWNLQTPKFPDLLGQVAMPSIIEGIDFDGTTALVANYYDGLQIVDVTNPDKPRILSSLPLPGVAYDVMRLGDYAYVVCLEDGLRIVDISDPRTPAEVGHYDTSGWAMGVFVQGSLAFVADNADGLAIIDVSRPDKPAWAGGYDTPGVAVQVFVLDRIAYVADSAEGVIALDVSTTSSPTVYGNVGSMNAVDVEVAPGAAFVATLNGGLVILDVSKGGTFPILDSFEPDGTMRELVLEGTEIFAACTGDGAVVIDVSSLPVGGSGSTGAWQFTEAVAVSGNYAYVGNTTEGVVVLDISNPDAPTQVDVYDTPDRVQSIHVEFSIAWVCDRFGGLIMLDLSTPGSPVFAQSYDTPGWARNVDISGTHAYVADGPVGGLRVLNVSGTPVTEAGFIDTPGDANDVAVSGGYAFVADGGSGVRVIDVSTPSAPFEAGFFEPDVGWVAALELVGNYLYIANANGGLLILDVSTPTAPTEADEILWGWDTAQDLKVAGDYVYVGDWEMGVRVFYIADPTNALYVGSYDNGGHTKAIAVNGNRVLLAEERIGVSILDFSPPPTATTIQAFDARAVAGGVELQWEIESDDVLEGYRIYRSSPGGAAVPVNADAVIAPDVRRYADRAVEPGNTYAYTLVVLLEDGSEIPSPEIEVTVERTALALHQNVPNPFNPTTSIVFTLPSRQPVTLSVFDVNGRLVRTLVDQSLPSGIKRYAWDGTNAAGEQVSSGVYFYRLRAGKQTLTRKMVMLK